MAAGHFLSLLVIAVFAILADDYSFEDRQQILFVVLGIGISSTIAFLLTSFVCIYCLFVVMLTNTERFSAQTLKAYKRMALAHFVQVIWKFSEVLTN